LENKEENLVKKTCRELGITQKELAEKIGFSTTSIYKWSNGSKIPKNAIKTLDILTELQNIKIEYEEFRKQVLIKP
jgi:predicted transcriptional regulator